MNLEIPKAERRRKRCAGQVQGECEILLLLSFLCYAATINNILTVSIEIQIIPGYGARHPFSAFKLIATQPVNVVLIIH